MTDKTKNEVKGVSGFGPFGPLVIAEAVQTAEVRLLNELLRSNIEYLRAGSAIGGR